MDTATKILILAGIANLVAGTLSGIPMGLLRQGGADTVPKYLTMLHLAGLMNGPALIALGYALTMSTLTPWFNTATALVLAVASALLLLKDTINWRQSVKDEFAEKSLGLMFGQVFGPLQVLGMIMATVAVVSGA